jgi:prepilin-type N-terminal cleavage/methylation domain-containing protein
MAEPERDAGFTLVEVVVCVALLAAACVASVSVLPTLVRASQSGVMRDAATNLARTALERVRAATSYYPASGYSADHSYALAPSASYVAAVRVHRGWCDSAQTSAVVAMTVSLAYDAASDTVTATVAYPRTACQTTVLDRVALSAQLAPSALAPGTPVTAAIGDPARQ